LQEVVEAVPRDHHIEPVRPKGKSGRVPDEPRQVRQAQFRLESGGALDHGGREVDSRDLTAHPSRSACDGTGPAGDIEHLVSGSDAGQPEEQ
jgi:hypothetical protein